MDPWIAKMVQHVRNTPPACLAGFRAVPDSESMEDWAGWSLSCACGADKGKVLGFPLKGCDPTYDGPERFVSPLAFACSACGQNTEIIDTDLHGYDAEIAKLEGRVSGGNYRGTGDREAIPCPQCQAVEFAVTVICAHSHFDLIDDEPELEPRAQEFFDAFVCSGTCTSCGKESNLANFELA